MGSEGRPPRSSDVGARSAEIYGLAHDVISFLPAKSRLWLVFGLLMFGLAVGVIDFTTLPQTPGLTQDLELTDVVIVAAGFASLAVTAIYRTAALARTRLALVQAELLARELEADKATAIERGSIEAVVETLNRIAGALTGAGESEAAYRAEHLTDRLSLTLRSKIWRQPRPDR